MAFVPFPLHVTLSNMFSSQSLELLFYTIGIKICMSGVPGGVDLHRTSCKGSGTQNRFFTATAPLLGIGEGFPEKLS